MLRRVALVRTDVSEGRIASIIRVTRIGELGTWRFRYLHEPHGVTSQKTAFCILLCFKGILEIFVSEKMTIRLAERLSCCYIRLRYTRIEAWGLLMTRTWPAIVSSRLESHTLRMQIDGKNRETSLTASHTTQYCVGETVIMGLWHHRYDDGVRNRTWLATWPTRWNDMAAQNLTVVLYTQPKNWALLVYCFGWP
jgi:hypothetical protein